MLARLLVKAGAPLKAPSRAVYSVAFPVERAGAVSWGATAQPDNTNTRTYLYDVSHGVGRELGGVLGVGVLLPPGRAPGGEVHVVSPGLTLLQVVDAWDGERPGLPGALGDPADHGVGGVAGVGHVEVVPGQQHQAVLGLQLSVVNYPGLHDVLGAAGLGLLHHDHPALLPEHGQHQGVGGVARVSDELPVLVELEGEGGDVLHHLGPVLDVGAGDVGHHPVDVHLGQQPGDAGVQQHDGVEGSPLRGPPQVGGAVSHDGDRDGLAGLDQVRVLPLHVQLGGGRRAEHLGHGGPVGLPA